MDTVDANRVQVWQALSELFLDTEVGDTTYEWIAQRISQSGYTLHQLQSILWNEVYPALQSNLKSMVGEWAGWTDDFLIEHIVVREYATTAPHNSRLDEEINRHWEQVVARLAPR